jgi:hypothetical protein
MNITLITSGGSYPLAGQWPLSEREFSGAVDFQISAEHVAEKIERVRAPLAKMFHRGNLSTTVSFSTRRVFANHAEALIYAADLEAETPRSGELNFYPGGSARYLQDVVVSPPACEVDGCAVRLDYVATGTAIGKRLPAVSISSAGQGLIASPGGGGTMPEEVGDAMTDGVLYRTVLDADGFWFEAGFLSPTNALVGSAAEGWLDPGGFLKFRFERSEDLQTWDHQVKTCPTGIESAGDGDYRYWARAVVPMYWQTTLRDFRLTATDYGKSITEIYCYNTVISLPNYPYAMPSQKATLQADLRAAGYSGALVTSTSGALTAQAIDHTVNGGKSLTVTQSGTNVTAVSFAGSTISLPSYPYAMPSQKATLQADLRTAGYSGAVVKLFADEWNIFLPDRSLTGSYLPFFLTITPGDPFKTWNTFGEYQGESPGTRRRGGIENTRDPAGNPLQEASRQFFRLGISAGPNNPHA